MSRTIFKSLSRGLFLGIIVGYLFFILGILIYGNPPEEYVRNLRIVSISAGGGVAMLSFFVYF